MVVQHQGRIADADGRVHQTAVGHWCAVNFLRVESFLEKLDIVRGARDSEVERNGMKTLGAVALGRRHRTHDRSPECALQWPGLDASGRISGVIRMNGYRGACAGHRACRSQ